MSHLNRHPSGIPTGGQFASRGRGAAAITLDDDAMARVRAAGKGKPLAERRAIYATAAANYAQRAAEALATEMQRDYLLGTGERTEPQVVAAPRQRQRDDRQRAFADEASFPLTARLSRAVDR